MPQQGWFCERCLKNGAVPYEEDEGVYTMLDKVGAAHQAISPDCPAPVGMLRVVNEEVVRETAANN